VKLGLVAIVLSLATGPANQYDWRPDELRINAAQKITKFEGLQQIALKYLERPYKMGGVGSPSFDCSGFTCRVFAEAGHAIPRVSRDQAKGGIAIEWERIQPGDLLFYVQEPGDTRISHVTLYLGERQMIHAASGSGKVLITNVDSSWYRKRFKAARRYIDFSLAPNATATSSAALGKPGLAVEMIEHSGRSYLPLTVRLSGHLERPSLGPLLSLREGTSIGLRVAAITEDQTLGLTLSPELRWTWPSWALSFALAAPIRFEVDETLAFGTFDHWTDGFRFVRSAAAGLPGADLELRFDRLGDVTIGGGFLVDRLTPGALASGVPGLSVRRTPLSFEGHYRRGLIDAHLFVENVFEAKVFGAALGTERLFDGLNTGVSIASDQAAGDTDQVRALTGVELYADYRLYRTSEWRLGSLLRGAGLRTEGEWGGGAQLGLEAQWRLKRRSDTFVSATIQAAWLGERFLDAVLGPTYLAARSSRWDDLRASSQRAHLGGELNFRYRQFSVGLGYGDGLSAGKVPADRRIHGVLQLSRIALWNRKRLDARVAYVARGFLDPESHSDILHANARLWWESWFATELFVEKGEHFEGGLGVMLAWEP